MTSIYLIRHAEAEGNLFRVAHGQYDSTITPQGYRQLSYLRRRFLDVPLDAVYGSDLLRAHTTAAALYVPKGLPFRPEPLLREVCLGDWEQRTWGEIKRSDLGMYVDFNKRPHRWQVAGAEPFTAVRDRTLTAVRRIAAAHPGGTVAATSHGAALRILLGTLEGLDLAGIGSTGHGDNTAVSLIEVEGEEIRVVFRDDATHLPPELSTFRRQSWHKDDQATEPGLWFRGEERPEGWAADAMLEEQAVGRVAATLGEDALRIETYALLPDFRGKRYGVQLLGQAVQYARRQGRERILLTCPADLAGYFSQYGFDQVSRRGDEVEMAMDLRLAIREIPE